MCRSKFLTSFAASSALLFSTASYADLADFARPSLSVGASAQSSAIKVNNWSNAVFGSGAGTLNGTAGNQQSLSLAGSYGFYTVYNFVNTVGLSVDITKPSLLSDPNGAFLATPYSDVKQKKRYSYFTEPGMLIAPSTLGYLKFSLNVLGINDPNSAQSIQSQNFVGIGYGVGVKTLVDAHWALSLEAQQINYKAKSDIVVNGATNPASAKPSQSMATLGLHYFY